MIQEEEGEQEGTEELDGGVQEQKPGNATQPQQQPQSASSSLANQRVTTGGKAEVSAPAPKATASWLFGLGTIVGKGQTPLNPPAPPKPPPTPAQNPPETPAEEPEARRPRLMPETDPTPTTQINGTITEEKVTLTPEKAPTPTTQINGTITEEKVTLTPETDPPNTEEKTKVPKETKEHKVTMADKHYEHLGGQFDKKDLNVNKDKDKGEVVYGHELPNKRTEFNTEVVSNAENPSEKDFSKKIQDANKALVEDITKNKLFGEPEPISVVPQNLPESEITQIEIAGVTFNCDMQNKTVAFTPKLNPQESFGLVLPFVNEQGENMSEDHQSFRALVINYENGKIDTLDGYQDLKEDKDTGRAYIEVPVSDGKTEKFYAKVSMKDIKALEEGVNAHLAEEKKQYEKAAAKIQPLVRGYKAKKNLQNEDKATPSKENSASTETSAEKPEAQTPTENPDQLNTEEGKKEIGTTPDPETPGGDNTDPKPPATTPTAQNLNMTSSPPNLGARGNAQTLPQPPDKKEKDKPKQKKKRVKGKSTHILPPLNVHGKSPLPEIKQDSNPKDQRQNLVNIQLLKASKSGNKDIVQSLLIHDKANPNERGEDDNTPLHYAVFLGNGEIVEALLEKGANINAQNKHGNTPLMEASKHENIEMVKLLVNKGADINAQNIENKTAFNISGNPNSNDSQLITTFLDDQKAKEALAQKKIDPKQFVNNMRKISPPDVSTNEKENLSPPVGINKRTQEKGNNGTSI